MTIDEALEAAPADAKVVIQNEIAAHKAVADDAEARAKAAEERAAAERRASEIRDATINELRAKKEPAKPTTLLKFENGKVIVDKA
jgi:hypothetical protein